MKTAKLLRVKPVECGGKKVEVNHQFSNLELIKILLMPKFGKKLTFTEAYRLRWHELSFGGYLFSYKSMNIPLDEWCMSRGYHVEFSDEEIVAIETTPVQH